MIYLIALIIALALIVVGIVKWKIHPFFVLLFAAIIYGFITGMQVSQIVDSINSGFGSIMGKIGLIIFFGVVIGTILEKSGGAIVIATRLLKLIGEKSLHLAMMVTGYLLSIPVFADSAFIIMNSLNKALSDKAKVAYAGTTAALAFGLMATHVMVPPTPGPIAAAGILDAELGSVILWGLLVSMLALVPCYFFATKIASRIHIPIHLEKTEDTLHKPKLWISLLSIVVPIILIVVKSAIPEFCSMAPKIPPAPVINIIGAAIRKASPSHPVAEYTFSSSFLGINNAKIIPINSAITGDPKNDIMG